MATWFCAIAVAGEVVQPGRVPTAICWSQLEDRTKSIRTAVNCRAVKITCLVHYQSGLGSADASAGVKHTQVPASVGRSQLICRTGSARTPVAVCTPQLAGGIQKEITERAISLAVRYELVEKIRCPRPDQKESTRKPYRLHRGRPQWSFRTIARNVKDDAAPSERSCSQARMVGRWNH